MPSNDRAFCETQTSRLHLLPPVAVPFITSSNPPILLPLISTSLIQTSLPQWLQTFPSMHILIPASLQDFPHSGKSASLKQKTCPTISTSKPMNHAGNLQLEQTQIP